MTQNRESESGKRQVLKSGDHVYCPRKNGLYDHHGVVVREDERLLVYHVRKDRSFADLCSDCKGIRQPNSGPIISCLKCFSRQERIFIIKYRKRVSQKNLDREIANESLRPGSVIQGYRSKQLYLEYYSLNGELHCHTKISFQEVRKHEYPLDYSYVLSEFSSCKSADEVVATARGGGVLGLGKYDLVESNCEHFAVFCQTNNPRSIQVARRVGAGPVSVVGRGIYRALKFGHSTCMQIRNQAPETRHTACGQPVSR